MKKQWIKFAKENNYKYLIIVYDMEDKDYYPLYLNDNIENEIKNIELSIRRQEVKEIIKIGLV